MAKKVRTPDPPRRVQAPKRRQPERKGLDPARRRALLVYGGTAAGIAAVVIVAVVVFATRSGQGSAASVQAAMAKAGCTFQSQPGAKSAEHIQSLNDNVRYSTFPPVSGRHYYIPAIWGDYTQPVDPRQAVHNQEHGGIVVWVGPKVAPADRTKINEFYSASPNAMLVTPLEDKSAHVKYPRHDSLGSRIALTAWTADVSASGPSNFTNRIATCPHFDAKAFGAFRDQFRGKGPERFPVGSLTPGT